jgi:hypothetical protein
MDLDQQSRLDGDLRSSSPATPSFPGPLLSVTSKSEAPSVPCTMLPSCVHSIAESCKYVCYFAATCSRLRWPSSGGIYNSLGSYLSHNGSVVFLL